MQQLQNVRPEEGKKFKGDSLQLHQFISNFETDVESIVGISDRTKLNELFKWVSGPALEQIRYLDKSLDPAQALIEAKHVFNEIWGLQNCTSSELLQKLIEGSSLGKKDNIGTWNLVAQLKNAVRIAEEAGDSSHLTSLESMRKIVKAKLPHLQDRFADYMYKIQYDQHKTISFSHLIEFLQRHAQKLGSQFGAAAMDRVDVGQKPQDKKPSTSANKGKPASKPATFAAVEGKAKLNENKAKGGAVPKPKPALKPAVTQKEKTQPSKPEQNVNKTLTCPVCPDTSDHNIYKCEVFQSASQPERHSFVVTNKLCFRCLSPHMIQDCGSKGACKTCNKMSHHTFLHRDFNSNEAVPDENPLNARDANRPGGAKS